MNNPADKHTYWGPPVLVTDEEYSDLNLTNYFSYLGKLSLYIYIYAN